MERVWTYTLYQQGRGQIFSYGRLNVVWATPEGLMHHFDSTYNVKWTRLSPNSWEGKYIHPTFGAEITIDVHPVRVEQ